MEEPTATGFVYIVETDDVYIFNTWGAAETFAKLTYGHENDHVREEPILDQAFAEEAAKDTD